MAVLAECEICGSQHRVRENLVGSKIRCKDCGTEFKVPEDHEITAERYFEEDGRLRPQPEETDDGLSPHTLILGGTCLMTMTLALVVCLFVLLYRLIF